MVTQTAPSCHLRNFYTCWERWHLFQEAFPEPYLLIFCAMQHQSSFHPETPRLVLTCWPPPADRRPSRSDTLLPAALGADWAHSSARILYIHNLLNSKNPRKEWFLMSFYRWKNCSSQVTCSGVQTLRCLHTCVLPTIWLKKFFLSSNKALS